jgi:hypothetical protein
MESMCASSRAGILGAWWLDVTQRCSAPPENEISRVLDRLFAIRDKIVSTSPRLQSCRNQRWTGRDVELGPGDIDNLVSTVANSNLALTVLL